VRLANGIGWEELGAMVNFYRHITRTMPWERTGACWADEFHPVVAVEAVCPDDLGSTEVVRPDTSK
jgi:hypothetical protein